jgi:hypothetical protein
VTPADLRDLSDKTWNEIVVDGRGNAYVNGVSELPLCLHRMGPFDEWPTIAPFRMVWP